MSVTFSIFPLTENIPTFREVLDLSTNKLNKLLKDFQIDFDAKIEVRLLSKDDDEDQTIDLNSLAKWENDSYAWFSVSSIAGGIDSYFWNLSDEEKNDNLEELLSRDLQESRKTLVKDCLENQIEWHFRKSAGQVCITAIAHGFVASSFAELTNGIIFSGDGGWDYQIFPATAEEFDRCFFRPDKALSEDQRKGAKDCLENLFLELKK